MGQRGPIPKPDSLKAKEGNTGKRRLNLKPTHSDAIDPPRAPKAPHGLDARARAEWKRIVKLLLRSGTLREVDQTVLGQLCATVSTLAELRKLLILEKARYQRQKTKKTAYGGPMFAVSSSGWIQQGPLVTMINNHVELVAKLSVQFGLTPASRRRISVGDVGEALPVASELSAEEALQKLLAED